MKMTQLSNWTLLHVVGEEISECRKCNWS